MKHGCFFFNIVHNGTEPRSLDARFVIRRYVRIPTTVMMGVFEDTEEGARHLKKICCRSISSDHHKTPDSNI